MKREDVKQYQQEYPKGTRVLLNHMGPDPWPVPDGTRGTVRAVDDIGQIHCTFENGRVLALIPGQDDFRKLTPKEAALEQEAVKVWVLTCLHTSEDSTTADTLGLYWNEDAALEVMHQEVDSLQNCITEEDKDLCWYCKNEICLGTYNGHANAPFWEPEIWHYTVSLVEIQ